MIGLGIKMILLGNVLIILMGVILNTAIDYHRGRIFWDFSRQKTGFRNVPPAKLSLDLGQLCAMSRSATHHMGLAKGCEWRGI